MKKFIFPILLVLNLAWIFSNSFLPSHESHTMSDLVVYGIETVFFYDEMSSTASSSRDTSSQSASAATSSAATSSSATTSAATSSTASIDGNHNPVIQERLNNTPQTAVLRTGVRKTAHATEFLLLGVLAVLCGINGATRVDTAVRLALLGLGAAVTDETIQIFSSRTSSLSDVWIDFAGFAVGCLLIGAVLYRKRKKDATNS